MMGGGAAARWRRAAAWLAAMLLALASAQAAAAAEARRVALVVGNGAYAAAGALANTRNDAVLVSGALRRTGFQTVQVRTDLGTQAFQRALRDFQALADGAEVALVYYAGHGIEAKGVNWLIPTDATLSDERSLPYEAIDANLVLQAVAGAKVRILLLDACRNNPFGRGWKAGTRSVIGGLARVEADDVLIIFAAAPGETAHDGAGANSPFAEAVARALPKPGVPVQLLGGVIRDDVMSATASQQRPFVSASMTGEPFYLMGGAQALAAAAFAPAVVATDAELTNWQSAERLNTVAAYEAYLASYPQGSYAAMARAAIAGLTASQAATSSSGEAAPRVLAQAPAGASAARTTSPPASGPRPVAPVTRPMGGARPPLRRPPLRGAPLR